MKFHFFLYILLIGQNYFCQIEKTMHNPPAPGFEVYDLCWGSYTTFKNLSAAATDYTWTIYDKDNTGAFTIELLNVEAVDVAYKFKHKGDYKVTLVASNGHLTALTQTVTVDSITKADFHYLNCQSRFLNLSRCANSFEWHFNDSIAMPSTVHSPTYFYSKYQSYHPWLIAKKNSNRDSLQKTVLGVPNLLTGKFNYRLSNDTAYFFAKDSVGSTSFLDYYWTWGDGTKTLIIGPTGREVWHYYPKKEEDETFYVYLLVRDACNQNYSSVNFSITGTHPIRGTSIYPNPLDKDATIHVVTERISELIDVTITDVHGRSVSNSLLNFNNRGVDINLSLIPKGIYLLGLNFNGEIIRSKIINN